MLREVRTAGAGPRPAPGAARRGCEAIQDVDGRNARYPVVLVHGYASSGSAWAPVRHALAEAGFGHIVTLNYNSFATDPAVVSAELTHQALAVLAAAGAPRVHLVGHSLGGLIVRGALAASAALSTRTASAVTIASPHRGTVLARFAPGRCARIMQRGHRPDLPGAETPPPVRWLAYYSDADRVVPPASARLDDPRCGAANVLIPGCGHLRICRDARLIRSLALELIRSETLAARTAAAGAYRETRAA